MKTIYKYPLNLADRQSVDLPENSKILHVDFDPNGQICLWAEIDTDKVQQRRTIYIFGTGHDIDREDVAHIGTVKDGPFMWHFYIKISNLAARPDLESVQQAS